jgi:hypothetical protein
VQWEAVVIAQRVDTFAHGVNVLLFMQQYETVKYLHEFRRDVARHRRTFTFHSTSVLAHNHLT